MEIEDLNMVAGILLFLYPVAGVIAFVGFAAGPNDPFWVVALAIGAVLYLKFGLFLIIGLKLAVYLLGKREK